MADRSEAAVLFTQFMEKSRAIIARRRQGPLVHFQKRIVTLQQKQARRRKQLLFILAVVAYSSFSMSRSFHRRCWSLPK